MHPKCRHRVLTSYAVARLAGAVHSFESLLITKALDRVDHALCAARHAVLAIIDNAYCGVHLFASVYRVADFRLFESEHTLQPSLYFLTWERLYRMRYELSRVSFARDTNFLVFFYRTRYFGEP